MKPEKFIRDMDAFLCPMNPCLNTSYYASFYFIKQDFGKETAAKVVNLSLSHLCLYPFEMREAAQVLKAGGSPEQIEQMIEDGTLEDYGKTPTMEDVKKSIRNQEEKER